MTYAAPAVQEQTPNKFCIFLQPTEEPEKDSSLVKGLKAVFNEESILDTSKNETHVTNKKLMCSGQPPKPSFDATSGASTSASPSGTSGEPTTSVDTEFVPPINTPGDGAPEGSEPAND